MPLTTVDLPARLADVFRSLRSGRHICRDDVADYRDLDRNEEQYCALFAGLGYELVHHGQGFYYFKGGNQLSTQRLQAITLFMLILFQDLEDRKFQAADRVWERTLLTRIFGVNELPHFQTAQRRSMLLTVGVKADTLHDKVLRPMARYGMLEMTGAEHFQFRSPIYRFVEVFMKFADDDWQSPLAGTDGSTLAPAANEEIAAGWTDDEEAVEEAS
jgi:chromosome condensin MukBEF MukE localization factor